MALFFMSLASIITVIRQLWIVARWWVWRVKFSCFCDSFFWCHFLFFDDESDDDLFDDKSDDDSSGSGLSGTCPFSFSEKYVGHVSGLFSFRQVIGIFLFSWVIGIFHLVESLEYFHPVELNLSESNLVKSNPVESIEYLSAQKHS